MTNAKSYLLSLENKGIKLGLERTKSIMQACDNPHKKIKIIQVIGTNGKGSTCAILSHILKTAGYNVGLYTSPHLNKVNERIRINGEAIKDKYIGQFIRTFKSNIDTLSISFFEAITALALWHFNQQNIDIAILETGLGGRLDSVSICYPELLLFTHISLDHQHILGETIKEIAYEKACAMKKNIECLSVPQLPVVEVVLNKQAKTIGCKIEYIHSIRTTSLSGNHQRHNAALAIKALQKLSDFTFDKLDFNDTLLTVEWPGRIQKIYNAPTIYFDVAHNESSFNALCAFINNIQIRGKKILILALQKHKHLYNSINNILNIFDKIILTQTNIRNYLPASKLQLLFKTDKTKIISNPKHAIRYYTQCDINDCIVIAGSHYLGTFISKEFKISFDNI